MICAVLDNNIEFLKGQGNIHVIQVDFKMLFDKIELLAEVLDFKEFIDPAGKLSTDAEGQG